MKLNGYVIATLGLVAVIYGIELLKNERDVERECADDALNRASTLAFKLDRLQAERQPVPASAPTPGHADPDGMLTNG